MLSLSISVEQLYLAPLCNSSDGSVITLASLCNTIPIII